MVRKALVALGALAALALSEPRAPGRRAVSETPAAEDPEIEASGADVDVDVDIDLGVGINAILPTDLPEEEEGDYGEGDYGDGEDEGDYDEGGEEGGYPEDPGYPECPPAPT